MRILIAEDEAMVSFLVAQTLTELDAGIVGSCGSLPDALSLARNEPLTGALLDVNLSGAAVYPVADVLTGRGIPFIFITGYCRAERDPRYREAPILEKPFHEERLQAIIAEHFHAAAEIA